MFAYVTQFEDPTVYSPIVEFSERSHIYYSEGGDEIWFHLLDYGVMLSFPDDEVASNRV